MAKEKGPFEFRILISADSPEEESQLVKAVASEFIRQGIPAVSVIADGEHNNYIDGEVYNITDIVSGVFQAKPEEVTAAHVTTHRSTTLN
jgi:hypothetical protein